MKISQRDVAAMDDLDNALDSESGYTGARRIVIFSLLMFVALGVWAWFGMLDEVSTGTGKVIPSSREQVLQSLDGDPHRAERSRGRSSAGRTGAGAAGSYPLGI